MEEVSPAKTMEASNSPEVTKACGDVSPTGSATTTANTKCSKCGKRAARRGKRVKFVH